ncbi:MAG: septation protein SpoVG family protein [Candidatus Ratteibacteria bacterium]|nr:septation protein SpoVG family protein [Candidatus Ratteibacteria bacterium]
MTVEITEVKVFMRNSKEGKLRAYASITMDNCFIVRDLKIIEGKKGLFVAMPSRKLRQACSKCGHPNVIGSKFCNDCGSAIEPAPRREIIHTERGEREARQDTHKDIAHPISVETRDYVQKKVMEVYEREKSKSFGSST